jgi:hypothetical protein
MNNVEKKGNNSGVITISGAFHDLTHLISQDMPVYPGDPQPEFEASATIEGSVNLIYFLLQNP